MKYKRLTHQKYSENIDLTQEYGYSYIYKRLYELEDKIETGALVEFNKPFYSNQFNAWCMYLKEGDYIKSVCLTKEQADSKLKELQEKDNERL